MTEMCEGSLFINGMRLHATSVETLINYNPATGKILGKIEVASSDDLESAVSSSIDGFKIWSRISGAERGRILNNAAKIIRSRVDELAYIEVLETGKPIQEAQSVDVFSGADAIEYFSGIAASLHGQHFDLGASFAYTRREPLGVCLGLGAWNYPFQIACWKAAPALACGNSMIFNEKCMLKKQMRFF